MKLDFSVAVHSILYLDAHRDSKVASRELAQSLHLHLRKKSGHLWRMPFLGRLRLEHTGH